jgi:hypothetical protein
LAIRSKRALERTGPVSPSVVEATFGAGLAVVLAAAVAA